MSGDVDSVLRWVVSLGLSGSSPTTADRPDLRSLPTEDWATLFRRCRTNRIVGLLWHAVEVADVPVNDDQRSEIEAVVRQQLGHCLEVEDQLVRLAEQLEAAGIDYRVLKGAAVAHLDYPRPEMRTFGDLDLLVRSEQYDETVRLIEATGVRRRFRELRSGFDRRFSKGVDFFHPSGVQIDLHRTLVMGPFGLRLDPTDLWSSTDAFGLASRSFPCLDPNLRFVHACYHAALGGRSARLVQLRDIAQMLDQPGHVDIDRCRAVVDRWGGLAVLARAVDLTWSSLELQRSELSDWAADFVPSSRDRRELRSYLDPEMGYAARCLTAIGAIPSWRDRMSFATALLFPSREYGAGRHGSRRRRLIRAAGDLRRLVSGPDRRGPGRSVTQR